MKDERFELAATANMCLVCFNKTADLVIIHHPTAHFLPYVLNSAQALNLAAWIVALVDPDGKEFPQLLEAVKKA